MPSNLLMNSPLVRESQAFYLRPSDFRVSVHNQLTTGITGLRNRKLFRKKLVRICCVGLYVCFCFTNSVFLQLSSFVAINLVENKNEKITSGDILKKNL